MTTKDNFAIEMLETIQKKLNDYLEKYEQYSKPNPELWTFTLQVHDTSLFDLGREDLRKVCREIREALEILKPQEKHDT